MIDILVDAWGHVHIGHEPVGVKCDRCREKNAVFHPCNAHGYPFQVHPHGGIHRLDGPVGVVYLCADCGRDLHKENDQIIRLSKYLKRGWL